MRFVYNWLLRHWILYIVGWMAASFVLTFTNYDSQQPLLPQWIGTSLAVALAFPVCYFAAKKLVPQYLYQKKIRLFISYIFLLLSANTVFTYLISLFIYHVITGVAMFRSVPIVLSVAFAILLVDLILISAACLIRIISDRFFMEQQLLETEKEKISTELNFLRSQVNPHFLFNVMNTIYFQIDKENIQARASVEMLSEMLRYQLYECTTDKIDIVKEVEYIKNYVAMQTLRMEKGTDIKLNIDSQLKGFYIAPLLLLPLIENAFKHISNFKEACKNKIHLTVNNQDESTLVIEVTNTYDQLNVPKHLLQSGGLGIQNLKRRLELLYHNKYELQTNKEAHIFQSMLKLQYDD